MNGICGFTGRVSNSEKIIKKMTDVTAHRGVADGVYSTQGLCMASLSLSGEGVTVYNEDRTMAIAFDGRIYNAQTLREELESEGHTFSTKREAEVIIHGFEQWGEEVLTKLRGMFAFAIYNEKDTSLFLARDPFGIKPLYYTNINRDLVFASEIKSVMVHPEFDRRLNIDALDSFLSFGYVVPPNTFFEDVYTLLPGHILWYKNGETATERYFEPRFEADEKMSEIDAVDKITEAVKNSVTFHKGEDSEVGCLLSGGVDSGYIATHFEGQKTFTISFQREGNSTEIDSARAISEQVGADHYTGIVTEEAFWKAMPRVQRLMDQPMADPSAIALYFTSGLAAQHVKAVMSGEGADEIFGGNEAYRDPLRFKNYHKLPYGFRKLLCKIAQKLPQSSGRDFIIQGTHPLEDVFVGSVSLCTNEEKWALLKDPTYATRAQAFTKKMFYRVRKASDLTKMQYLDINMWLAGDVLQRTDRMSIVHSLELRLPYLDKEVFKVASSLPQEYRASKQGTKQALRKAAARKLSADITEKPSSGFMVPLGDWLRQDRYYEMIKEEFRTPTAQKYFNIDVLLNFLDDHYAGDGDYSRQIWAVYSFLVWHNEYFQEITTEEITEEAIAEVEAIAETEDAEIAESTMNIADSKRLDELFGLAFGDEESGVSEDIEEVAEEDTASDAEDISQDN